MIEFGHGTHVGLRRTRNEDTYFADAQLGLFLVTDGMGGHRHGEVAAALVRDTLVDLVGRGHNLVDSIRRADERLLSHSRQKHQDGPMGTTVAALKIEADRYEVAWVGDSRIYLWQHGLKQVSHDHSLVQELVEHGVIAASQARRHPQRNVITQALGITATEQLHIGLARGRTEPGMSFLLCSDGLSEDVPDQALAEIVARQDLVAQECVDHLLLCALDGGGNDNITAILARIN
ncbi:MAG: protein phosphatase 2C domain-containing protein [Dyella sp.]